MSVDRFSFWSAEMDPHTPMLDVHGRSVVDALYEVDFFIDRVLMSDYRVAKIIHGAGTGALRCAISAALRQDARVIGMQDSERSGEGGAVLYVALQ